MEKKLIIIFFCILFVAAFLRLYRIADIPPGVNQDEASIGFTAYSLLETGKDEYGRAYPLSFQSFGDWKLPLYIYITTFSVKLFGLSEIAVRIPSALFGIGTVILVFFLVRELFKDNKLSIIAMLLMAISPWSLHFSRVESESNAAVFLTTLASFLFLKSLKGKIFLIIPSLIIFALTYFTYAGNYVFTTLLILGIFLIYKKELLKNKYLLLSLGVFVLLSGFIALNTVGGNQTKVSGIGIFGDPSVVHAKIEIPRNEHENKNSFITRMFHNRVVFGVEKFAQNYIKAFSAEFLFIKGGENKAHNIANFGNMYLIEAPFLFLGLVILLFFKKGKEKQLILFWFLIGPVAASITKDAPHTNRMFAIFPILPLVVAIGINESRILLQRKFSSKIIRKLVFSLVIVLFCFNMGIYFDHYYVHFLKEESENWGVGYKQLVNILSNQEYKDKNIIMSKSEYSPYIFLLFYQKYDPKTYQDTAVRYLPTQDGFVHVKGFGRYEFRNISWENDIKLPNTILVERTYNVPGFVKTQYSSSEVILENGKSMFTIVEIK